MYFVFHFVAAKRKLCHVLAELSLCSYNFGIMTQSLAAGFSAKNYKMGIKVNENNKRIFSQQAVSKIFLVGSKNFPILRMK
ncbi:MAG TPA: hypothetical protein DCP53_03315 [Elusimicrobia bacterium]|nr:hypothetical protein [Elusimicrobiota bacterium]